MYIVSEDFESVQRNDWKFKKPAKIMRIVIDF